MTEVVPTEAAAGDRIVGAERERAMRRHRRFRPGAARRADIAWGYLFLLPAVAFLGVFLVEPFVKAAQYSLESWDGIGPARYIGLDNYKRLWTDPVERSSLVHLGILFCFYSLI